MGHEIRHGRAGVHHVIHIMVGWGAVANPGFWVGGGKNVFLRDCRWSEAELHKWSELQMAGVQGPPLGPGSSWVFHC